MPKRITAKIDEYVKDGQTKGKYVDVGVIMSNQNGEYILLNPTIDLAGILMRQRILAQQTQKKAGNAVMCSIFDNDQQQGAQSNQRPAQGGNQNTGSGSFADDDIPF
jgi:hypothetical protein